MPKGNPNPSPQTRFKLKGDRPLTYVVQVSVDENTRQRLKALGDRKTDFLRAAIAQALDREQLADIVDRVDMEAIADMRKD